MSLFAGRWAEHDASAAFETFAGSQRGGPGTSPECAAFDLTNYAELRELPPCDSPAG